MKLINFLAQNGLIRSTSELRRISEFNVLFVNDQLITLKELNETQVCSGDSIKLGKSEYKVYIGP